VLQAQETVPVERELPACAGGRAEVGLANANANANAEAEAGGILRRLWVRDS
jgi:hypothetical protein